MVELFNDIDVFLITNGRKSTDYVVKSLKRQKGVEFGYTVIKDKKWLDACNECLNFSNVPYYLRLDDDMILHPRAIHFFIKFIEMKYDPNAVFYCLKLWEPWNNRLCGKVKIYNRQLTKQIGFEVDSRGKVDKIFKKKAAEKGFKIVGDKTSAISIHAACSYDDNYNYSNLRKEINDPTFAIREKEIQKLDKVLKKTPYEEQLRLADAPLGDLNKKGNTLFGQFLNECEGRNGN